MSEYRNQLFPISYYKDNIENNEKIKNEISPLILEDSKSSPRKSPYGWLTNKIITSFEENGAPVKIFGENTFFQKVVQNEYAKCFNKFFDDYYKITINDIWYSCYVDGEYQEIHDHLGDFFHLPTLSCIHFLSFDKDRHRPVCFYDPSEQIRSTSLEFASHNYDPQVFLDIKEGDFIMFPSFLKHAVYPSPPTPDYPRITISFNIGVSQYAEMQQQVFSGEPSNGSIKPFGLCFEGRGGAKNSMKTGEVSNLQMPGWGKKRLND